MDPVFLINKQFRASRILAAPHIDDAQIVPAVFIGIILRLYMQPLLHLIQMVNEIGLILHIPINQSIVTDML